MSTTETAKVPDAALAAAWDAGYKEAIENYGCDIPWDGFTDNPYRQTPITGPTS